MSAILEIEATEAARTAFLRAVRDGDRWQALAIARDLLARGCPPRRLYLEVFDATQRELGRLWEAGTLSVANEHLATACTGWVLTRLYEVLPIPAPRRGKALLAGIEGELHQLGLQMVADLLETEGWEVRFIGTNTPADALVQAVREWTPDVVGLSVTLSGHLAPTLEAARRIRALRPAPLLVLGGRAAAHAPSAGGAWHVAAGLVPGLELFNSLRTAS